MRGLTLSDKIRSEDICMQLGEEGDIIHDIKVCEVVGSIKCQDV
jgi:hypothetical protein